ncbi:MAG: TonB family protein [Bacteroidales bacterium]|nr:TonB family protein [Bacteroidales bacterium]
MYLGVEHKIKAATATIVVVVTILLILLWVHFRTPIPPYPEEGGQGLGLEISLGYGIAEQNPPQSEPEAVQNKQEEILTQDYEEADPIPEAKKTSKIKQTKGITDNTQKESVPEINEKALFKKRTSTDNAENAGTFGTSGQQGSGVGDGEGTGKGKGIGAGIGDGISFSLEGRSPVSLIKPNGNFQTSGKVVVEITVDANGNVISAVPGVKGSTTLDEYLLQIAKEAAMASKFSPNPRSTIQKGTITYRFVLQ